MAVGNRPLVLSVNNGKRQRVTRACDECRKKKVKCDGQQPCIHCTVYSYECTYKQPARRPRAQKSGARTGSLSAGFSSTQLSDVAGLEQSATLEKLKTLFHELFPDLPSIDNVDVSTLLQVYTSLRMHRDTSILSDTTKEYNMIMQKEQSSTDLDTKIGSPYLNSLTKPGTAIDSDNNNDQSGCLISAALGREIQIMLPPKHIALEFVRNTWEYCCVLLRFYHRPSFLKRLDVLYETDPLSYTSQQIQFLPLLYSTMAVGALFSKSIISGTSSGGKPQSREDDENDKFLQDEGYKYFIAARKLIDITNASNLDSIQTILMLFIFLQCSARLSTCYTYIGLALRSALREGYHRVVQSNENLTPIEIEMRKRLFYTIYKMDIYVNAMVGLPRSLSRKDFNQTLPLDLDDDYITETNYHVEMQCGKLSTAGIANCHTRLMMILDDIVTELYPVKRTSEYISHSSVTKLELKLMQWARTLPSVLVPNAPRVPPEYERPNKLLHLSFLHVQLILYRPFIHYLSKNMKHSACDTLSYERAKNSITVARTVVQLAKCMMARKLLQGSYWYACYTLFYSVAGLLFYIHEAEIPDTASAKEYTEILKDAEIGRNVLISLKDSSTAAQRTYDLLNDLFEKLNTNSVQLAAMHIDTVKKCPDNDDTNLVDDMALDESSTEVKDEDNKIDSNEFLISPADPFLFSNGVYVSNPTVNHPAHVHNNFKSKGVIFTDLVKKEPGTFEQTCTEAKTNVDDNEVNSYNTKLNTNTNELPNDTYFDFSSIEKFAYLNNNEENPTITRDVQTPSLASSVDVLTNADELGDDSKVVSRESNLYDPGILEVLDQIDAQLFGRYLPAQGESKG